MAICTDPTSEPLSRGSSTRTYAERPATVVVSPVLTFVEGSIAFSA
jgi:hypothetical protein